MTKKRVLWFARGGDIARCGPFETQIEAVNAMRLVKRPSRQRLAADCRKGRVMLDVVLEPEQRAEFPWDVFIWPEEVEG